MTENTAIQTLQDIIARHVGVDIPYESDWWDAHEALLHLRLDLIDQGFSQKGEKS